MDENSKDILTSTAEGITNAFLKLVFPNASNIIDEGFGFLKDVIQQYRFKNWTLFFNNIVDSIKNENIANPNFSKITLMQILEKVGIENDEDIIDKYSNLFINLLLKDKKNLKTKLIIEFLSQMTIQEYKLLELIESKNIIELMDIYKNIEIEYDDIDNLKRLGLIEFVLNEPELVQPGFNDYSEWDLHIKNKNDMNYRLTILCGIFLESTKLNKKIF